MKDRKGVAVLGATGSVGRAALDVLRTLNSGFRVVALSAGSNWEKLAAAAAEFRPSLVALAEAGAAGGFKARLAELSAGEARDVELVCGEDAARKAAALEGADIVLCAVPGFAGLLPTLEAVRAGKQVAVANKEAIVAAGRLVLEEAARSGASVIPVDSEHSAVFQALRAGERHEVRKIVLTASGGPFRELPERDLENVTVEEALRHPTWSMGPKITVESATLLNKAYEVVEACVLFAVPPERVEVWIHPQSVVHCIVEFTDGSGIAQLGRPDMRVPIQYALTYPERLEGPVRPLRVEDVASLTFERPRPAHMRALELGYEVARTGGVSGSALSAAGEVAVAEFLAGRLRFTDIVEVTGQVLRGHEHLDSPTLEDIISAFRRARAEAGRLVASLGAERGRTVSVGRAHGGDGGEA